MAIDFSQVTAITIPEGSVSQITDSSSNVLWSAGGGGASGTMTLSINEVYTTYSSNRYFASTLANSTIVSSNYTTFYDMLLGTYNSINSTAYTTISNVKIDSLTIQCKRSTIYGIDCGIGSSNNISYNTSNWLTSKVVRPYTSGSPISQGSAQYTNLDWAISDFTLSTAWGLVYPGYITARSYTSSGNPRYNYVNGTSATTSTYLVVTGITYTFDVA